MALALALGACGDREQKVSGDAATQTIEPAKPQPDVTGSDAMTQTVDVEKGRSEVEARTVDGAELPTSGETTTSTAATTSTAPATTTTQ